MKKSIRRLVAVGAVVLGLGFGTTALAASTNEGNMGSTTIGITIVNNNPHGGSGGSGGSPSTDTDNGGGGDAVDPNSPGISTGGDGDAINEDIPSGHNPMTSVTSGHSAANKPAGAVASVVHSGTADLVAGRLPQTGESQVFLASVFGLFLLVAITLLAVVRWQARLLRENK